MSEKDDGLTLARCLEAKTAPIRALVNEIVAERDALRKRNEKLEAFHTAYRAWMEAEEYAATTTFVNKDDMSAAVAKAHELHRAVRAASEALADLDKEEPA